MLSLLLMVGTLLALRHALRARVHDIQHVGYAGAGAERGHRSRTIRDEVIGGGLPTFVGAVRPAQIGSHRLACSYVDHCRLGRPGKYHSACRSD